MESESITQLLTAELPSCEIVVEGGDGKFLVTAVGNVFEGLNAVKRQQTIYKILNEYIASGAIHAVTMRLMTEQEQHSN
ncbi:MAG TPA: BolA/IbaG family iron-sulfur metabolism protein [Porticoccaceae bacterium]|nr:BolA/IbaG family iron-sulfur metabolism protein [Gammaproteobacteria bacterium]HIL59161.1 BolA/IbaG family iron-sulfur metabolism protein [Porticoccaceae bacterium]